MASADAGKVFLKDLVALYDPRAESSENCNIPAEEDFDDDASQCLTCTVNSASVKDIYSNKGCQYIVDEIFAVIYTLPSAANLFKNT